MALRVCIPTAGTGSRLGPLTQYVNKSLVSLANRPILCHLIEQFPDAAEFVIALGHKGELVRSFLKLAYPNRTFFFAEVSPFEGPGSGLGYSLLCCRDYLQQPFIFISCDTLVRGMIPTPHRNWMGYAERADLDPYRTLEVKDGRVVALCEKKIGKPGTHKPYIGLAGIADYQAFWQAMDTGGQQTIDEGESHGLRALIESGIDAHAYDWFDTGNPQALEQAREAYLEPDAPNILDKANEAIWFIGSTVIKYSDDKKFIANRVKRATQLDGFAPTITGSEPNMYRYEKAEGRVLSDCITLPLFEKFLARCKDLWSSQNLSSDEHEAFDRACLSFYKDKTLERVALFYKNFDRADGTETINGQPMPRLSSLFDALDWSALAKGTPVRFHGDLHFENVLWSEQNQRFTFLDWRQDFGGSLTTGDVYYDLAKLLHGLIVCHELIAKDEYEANWEGSALTYRLPRKQILIDCEKAFEAWLVQNGYDVRKVRILTALIYLNIAALHHFPYCLLLYGLGKSMLAKELEPSA